jgi:VIT1/CCC1 family predicted Fe2+/Mn2+ transporter
MELQTLRSTKHQGYSTIVATTTEADPIESKSKAKAQEAFAQRDVEASRAEHMKNNNTGEQHSGGASDYVKAIVFGGLDGIMTTFAIIAAAAGAGETWKTILVFGFANVFADAFSMGFGEFTSGNAELDHALRERAREEWEVENSPDLEKQEMVELYQKRGLSKEDSEVIVGVISKDPRIFVDFMMVEELQILIDLDDKYGPLKQAGVMFGSFIFFGLIPLYAYLGGVGKGTDYVFWISTGLTALALLLLGAVKGALTGVFIPLSSAMMLFNGCVSGGVSFGIGVLVEKIVS